MLFLLPILYAFQGQGGGWGALHTWSENPFDGPAWAGGGPAPRLADGVLCCLLPFSEPVGTQPIPKQRAFHFQTLSRALAKGLFFCRAQTWRWELSGQLPSSQTGKRERPLAAQPPAAQPPAAQPCAALRRRAWGAPRALRRGYGVCVARGPAGGRGAQRQAHVVAEPPVVEAMDLWTPCV